MWRGCPSTHSNLISLWADLNLTSRIIRNPLLSRRVPSLVSCHRYDFHELALNSPTQQSPAFAVMASANTLPPQAQYPPNFTPAQLPPNFTPAQARETFLVSLYYQSDQTAPRSISTNMCSRFDINAFGD